MLSGVISLPASSRFAEVEAAVRSFRWRPDVQAVEIGSPQRLAPYALALEAEVTPGGDDAIASGRLVILHNPSGDDAWQGTTRFVSYVQADVEFEMASDPLLADVAWSWLLDALREASAEHRAASGTVTAMTSRSFGSLDTIPQRAEIEMRCSWTSVNDGEEALHVAAWQELLCVMAGLEPLVEGITSLSHRSRADR